MRYKGYRILINYQATHFYELDKDGNQGKQLDDIKYLVHDDEPWYSVVGEDNWVQMSFETIEECKQYIDEEAE